MIEDETGHVRQVLVQEKRQLLCVEFFGNRGEAANVAEHHGDLGLLRFDEPRIDEQTANDFRAEILTKRRSNAALLDGAYASVGEGPNVFAYRRGQNVMVALNFSGEPQSITLPGVRGGSVLLSSALPPRETIDSDTVSLAPYEALIVAVKATP